ncbi:uncharacterized protein LOC113019660 isoform X3 [Astatotilapia calliptera]|uniref:uncharacterized protein LOC113019660 isoform X3 n=1 Tax=Astatotilapia calliptera TaxID=8154 RepID=UPI000E42786D|nr:uncharacterized protein LOC113019660 isoform X3 [Astatotilapia calliptera]
MGMLLLFLLIINVSQHALAVVEVNEGERSVLLLCLYSGFIPEDSTVMWTRSDLDPNSVHLRQEGGDNLRGQNQHYRGRTSMNRYALITNDFSLTLTKPSKTDSGNYTCSISAGGKERRLGDIQLQVKDQQVEVTVREGSESVILPCNTTPDLPKNTTVEWTRSEVGLITVHEYSNRNDDFMTQDEVYRDRTKMNKDLLRTGDLSLSLKYPTERDSGGYICTIYRDKDILRQKVVLQVKEPFPPWATALLVLLVLLVVFGCLLFNFRHYFMSDYQKVEVDSGVESVQLPLKTIIHLPEKAKVEWKNSSGRIVHVYENGSDQPEEQNHCYKDRTEMNIDPLKPGDLSLTLKHPTDRDNSTYTCTVYSTDKKTILMKKQVELKVKVPLVEVEDSGLESVQLAHKATLNLPKDAKVEWTDSSYRMLHVYPSSSDQPEEQDRRYRGRTEMNEDLLKNGDLTLTLKHPTDWDRGPYTCTVYSTEGNILMRKQVDLKVGVCQVEVEEGAESVQLPFQTTKDLPADAKVVWWDIHDRKVHVFSDQAGEQDQVYRDRTEMNNNPLKAGDLSLTLKHPTERDSGTYRCKVYGRTSRYKKVQLRVKGRVQVQDQTGDIRNRSSSIDPTPLMADQSV